MSTPIHVFAELAAKYGGVDAGDIDAVQHWYEQDLPALPRNTIEDILEELLKQERHEDTVESTRAYPKQAPLPTLDQAPPAALPLFATGWRALFRRLLGGE